MSKTIAEKLDECEYNSGTLYLYKGKENPFIPLIHWPDKSISKVERIIKGMNTTKLLKFHDRGIGN